jgi:hypothetical protein
MDWGMIRNYEFSRILRVICFKFLSQDLSGGTTKTTRIFRSGRPAKGLTRDMKIVKQEY